MPSDREKKIKELFWTATEMAKENRPAFLSQECLGDKEMYEEVLSLLESHQEAESFLETPVANIAAKLAKTGNTSETTTSKEAFLEQLSGRVLEGKYLVEKQLGQGGMGAVYQAIHLGTKRPVALKVIAPQFMTHAEFVERFKREAEAAGRLSHPNVVNVTDFGVASFGSAKVAYLVMEYLKGFTLGELLKKKSKLPISFTIEIIEQVCSAITEAHNQGIIHRDLKPDNIWLEPDGRGSYYVKVLDFGLAKLHSSNLADEKLNALPNIQNSLLGISSSPSFSGDYTKKIQPFITGQQSGDLTEAKTQLIDEKATKVFTNVNTAGNIDPRSVPEWMTRVGMVLGTPLYMSPEQCHGKELDPRTDIYSLGVIAYQMLSGETPFSGDMYQLIHKHSEMPPPPLQKKRRDIPKAIAELVMTALSKNPTDRFPTARAFATALRANLEGDIPLLHEAFGIYWKHFLQIQRISLPINLFFVFIISLISTTLLATKFNFVGNNWVQGVWWVLPIVGLLFFGELSTGAISLAIKELQETGKISVNKVSLKLTKSFSKLFHSILESHFLALSQIWKLVLPAFRTSVQYSLISPIEVLENKEKTLERSKDLVTELYSIASSIKLRSFLIKSIAYGLFLATFMVNSFLYSGLELDFVSQFATMTFTTFILPGLFLAIVNPLIDITLVLFYFKAREAKGENIYQQKSLEEIEIVEKIKLAPKRKTALAFLLILSILFSSLSYSLIIPPFGEIPKVIRPIIEKVPNSENAWISYNLAIQDLIDFPVAFNNPSNKSIQEIIGNLSVQQLQSPTYGSLEKVALGFDKFDEKQLAYIDSHQKAINHLLEGAKKPKVQFYSEAPTAYSPVPNLLQMRALTILAAAQVRYLAQNGKLEQALDLALANYEMATDIGADENCSLISGLISVVCRSIAARSIFVLINSGKTTVEMDKEIASFVTEQDNRMPNAYQLFKHEREATEATFEDILIKQTTTDLDVIFYNNSVILKFLVNAFPGLRVNIYKRYYVLSRQKLELLRNNTENWDFVKAEKDNERIVKEANPWNWGWTPSGLMASAVFYIALPNTTATMKSLYTDNCIGKTLVTFAACSAYKKAHNEFPATLSAAMLEVNLALPIDLATSQRIGYKLENNLPVVWFAGVDGINDGGEKAYSPTERHRPTPGRDFVFSYGQLPLYDYK
ncbi:MAG: serine/threonine protein kinase [Acidobacteria bacterium]|nr:serine/threonine protein kinase [Acidobacteriota bacterium]